MKGYKIPFSRHQSRKNSSEYTPKWKAEIPMEKEIKEMLEKRAIEKVLQHKISMLKINLRAILFLSRKEIGVTVQF